MQVVRRSPSRFVNAALAAGVAVVALAAGCMRSTQTVRDEHVDFARLDTADRVVISTASGSPLRTTRDTTEIASLTSFAASHDEDWETPWSGPPVAAFRANFYAGDRYLGHLGVGADILTTDLGGFLSRSVSADDRARVVAIFAVPDPYAAPPR